MTRLSIVSDDACLVGEAELMVGNPLLDIPTWNQNRDPLPDGGLDPFRATDCGEECAAMRIFYRTRIELPAGILRQLIPGHQDHGETAPADLVRVLRIFGLHPVSSPVPLTAIRSQLTRSIDAAAPPIVLGRWLASDSLHWVLGVDASSDGLLVNDPWDGQRRLYPWDKVLSRYAGWCIL